MSEETQASPEVVDPTPVATSEVPAAVEAQPAPAPTPAPVAIPPPPAPPLYFHLIEAVTTKSGLEKEDLLDCLAQSSQITDIVESLRTFIANAADRVRKESLFVTLLEVLNRRNDLKDGLESETLTLCIQTISGYQFILSALNYFELVVEVLKKIYSSIPNCNDDTVLPLINGEYAPVALGVYGLNHEVSFTSIFERIKPSNIPSTIGMTVYFSNHKWSELSETEQPLFEQYNAPQVFRDHFGGNDTNQYIALRYLTTLLPFLTDYTQSEQYLKIIQQIIGRLSNSNEAKNIEIAKVFAGMPVKTTLITPELQVGYTNLLAPYVLTYESQYNDLLISYVTQRKELPDMLDTCSKLVQKDATLRAGFIISVELDFFAEVNFIPTAFVFNKLTRFGLVYDAIPYFVKKNKFTKDLYKMLWGYAISGYASQAVITKKDLREKALAAIAPLVAISASNGKRFGKHFPKDIVTVTDLEVLKRFAEEIANITLPEPEVPPLEAYLTLFCHIYGYIGYNNLQYMYNFAKLYNIAKGDVPKTVPELIETCMPVEYLPNINAPIESKRKEIPYIIIIQAALKDLNDDQINNLLKFALDHNNEFEIDFGIIFFQTFAVNYFQQTLDALEKLEAGPKVSNNIFINKKKRERDANAVFVICRSLLSLLEGRELTAEQKLQVLKIIAGNIPQVNYVNYHEDMLSLNKVFPLLDGAEVSEELAQQLLIEDFAPSFPIFLKGFKSNDDIALSAITIWAQYLLKNPEAIDQNETIASLYFGLVKKSANNLVPIYATCQKYWNDKKITDIKPFLDFGDKAIKVGVAAGQRPRGDVYLLFFIDVTRFCVSPEAAIRQYAFNILTTIYKLKDVPPCDDTLTPDQLQTNILTIYGMAAKTTAFSKQFAYDVLWKILTSKDYQEYYSILIRGIINNKDKFINDTSEEIIVTLFSMVQKMSQASQYHVIECLMQLALVSMDKLLPLLVNGSGAFRGFMLRRILNSPAHRTLFMKELLVFYPSQEPNIDNMELFELLPIIIETEGTLSLSISSFGSLITDVITWMGIAYAALKTVSKASLRYIDIHSTISDVLDQILAKSCFVKPSKLTINLLDAEHFIDSISQISNYLIKVDIERLKDAITRVQVLVNSKNTSVVCAAGLFGITLLSKFRVYTSELATEINNTLLHLVATAFSKSTEESPRVLGTAAATLPVECLAQLTQEDCVSVYEALINTLSETENVFRLGTTILLGKIISNVPAENLDLEKLYEVLKVSFNLLRMKPEILTILEVYIGQKVDIDQYVDSTSNLSLIGLLNFSVKYQERVLPILRKIVGNENIIEGFGDKVTTQALGIVGLRILRHTKPEKLDDERYQILHTIALAVKDAEEAEVKEFQSAFVKFLLPIAGNSEHKYHTQSIESIKTVIP